MTERPILFSAPMVRALLEGRKTQTRRVVKHRYETLKAEPFYVTGKVLTDLPGQPGAWMEHRHRCQDDPAYTGSPAPFLVLCPYGAIGDRLWVRETCRAHELTDDEAEADTFKVMERKGLEYPLYGLDGVIYKADDTFREIEPSIQAAEAWGTLYNYRGKRGAWVNSIHMPRWASRITLEISGVRVERLQAISYEDACAEGCKIPDCRREPVAEGETWEQTARRLRWPQRDFESLWQSINGPDSWAANPWVWVIEFKRVTP